MANRKLERMGIDPSICERFTRNNVTTVREFLSTSPLVLMLQADLSMKEVKDLIAMISEKVHAKPQNGLLVMHSRSQETRFLSSGISKFDAALKGGLLVGSISEICGAPGAGKTQFCLNCTLQATSSSQRIGTALTTSSAQSPGVIYIDTELKFDPNRLIQMAIEKYPETYSSEFRIDAPHQIDSLLGSVKVKRPASMKELQEELGLLQTTVIAQNIKLVVIDSIAALARKEGFNERDKEEFFIAQASQLKKIAELCHCAVLATNQVTPSGSANPSDLYGDAIHDGWGTYQPTLGPTWHHCVSTRLTVRLINTNMQGNMHVNVHGNTTSMYGVQGAGTMHGGRSVNEEEGSESQVGTETTSSNRREVQVRCLSITKSPVAPPFELNVVIAPKGVEEHVV